MSDQLHLKWGWIAWALIAAVAGFVCGVATLPARGAEVQHPPIVNGATLRSDNGIYDHSAFQNGVVYTTVEM